MKMYQIKQLRIFFKKIRFYIKKYQEHLTKNFKRKKNH